MLYPGIVSPRPCPALCSPFLQPGPTLCLSSRLDNKYRIKEKGGQIKLWKQVARVLTNVDTRHREIGR